MATWVTHLMIADKVLAALPQLDRRGFCVGNIAPDCNIENEDWTAFDPPRAVTHFMGSGRKVAADCERFYKERIGVRRGSLGKGEELSFLLGYYAHLIADAEFQAMIRDEARIEAMWQRFDKDEALTTRARGMDRTWDSAKKLFSKADRFRERAQIEAEYLESYPYSGYLTEIIPLESFPDYLSFLPTGAIVRKIGVMGDVPQKEKNAPEPICISREEYMDYVDRTAALVIAKIQEKGLL